ncbi:MAG: hypothetical protein HDQ88_11285 [Clostridia bacterium]|nr:hypothetical protein [Clostridia bacterium]
MKENRVNVTFKNLYEYNVVMATNGTTFHTADGGFIIHEPRSWEEEQNDSGQCSNSGRNGIFSTSDLFLFLILYLLAPPNSTAERVTCPKENTGTPEST